MGKRTLATPHDEFSGRPYWKSPKWAACSDPHLRLSSAQLLAATIASAPAQADATPWDGDTRSGVRLIAGGGGADGLRAGVEIRLAPGWKTYWRYPGDSGVPPQFDFGKSENVNAVTVGWPAPQRITDSEGVTIGYKGGVVFPLTIVPQDASRPVKLRLNLDYAICEKLCVPAQGRPSLSIKPGSAAEPAHHAADKTVPQPRPLGANAALSVKSVTATAGQAARIHGRYRSPRGHAARCLCRGPGAGLGAAASPKGSRARRTGCSASLLRSMACRPAPAPKAPRSEDHGSRGHRRDRDHLPARLSRALRLFCRHYPKTARSGRSARVSGEDFA